jgi:hypothetical protein
LPSRRWRSSCGRLALVGKRAPRRSCLNKVPAKRHTLFSGWARASRTTTHLLHASPAVAGEPVAAGRSGMWPVAARWGGSIFDRRRSRRARRRHRADRLFSRESLREALSAPESAPRRRAPGRLLRLVAVSSQSRRLRRPRFRRNSLIWQPGFRVLPDTGQDAGTHLALRRNVGRHRRGAGVTEWTAQRARWDRTLTIVPLGSRSMKRRTPHSSSRRG